MRILVPVLRFLLVLFALPTITLAQALEIHHINIGQGDSTLILGPPQPPGTQTVVLIDAGDRGANGNLDGGLIVRDYLAALGITEIDYFVASHYDSDHIGGVVTGSIGVHGHSFLLGPNNVPGALGDDDGDGIADWEDGSDRELPDPNELGLGDDIRILNWIDRGDVNTPTTAVFDKYLGMATRTGVRTSLATQSDVNTFQIDLGSDAVITAVVANGFVRNRSTPVANVNTENERSIGFWLRFGGFDYLTCGDLTGRRSGGENAEVELAVAHFLNSQDVNVDVLHVNHHGADNTSDEEFLSIIKPELAIISAGNGNSHHHPHRYNLRRLSDADVTRIILTNYGSTRYYRRADVRPRLAIAQSHVVLSVDGTTYTTTISEGFTVDD